MADTIGRADYELAAKLDQLKRDLLSGDALVKDSVQKTEKEATEANTRAASKLSGLVRAGATAIAGTATALFGIATKSLVELDDVTKEYAASVGATAEEEQKASAIINRLNAEKRQGYREIGSTLAALRQDMHLSQEEAAALADRVLDFAKVARQAGPDAVHALDESMDAFNLTQAQGIALMDKLVFAHERGAGAIGDVERNLNLMAPALKAANLNVDDGIALMLAFADAGIDASLAPRALQTALSKVKSPEELQRLIEDIRNTTDNFDRSRKASELFGVRAGAKMADLLKPGSRSLQDYRADLVGATGALTKASDKMDESFGARARQMLKAFGSTLTEVLGQGGPLITGAASLASLATTLGLAGFGKNFAANIAGQMKSAGAEAAGAFGTGFGDVISGAQGTIIGNLTAEGIKNRLINTGLIGRVGIAAGVAFGVGWSTAMTVANLGINAAIMALGGNPAAVRAAISSGTLLGGRFGMAFKLAFVAGLVAIAPELEKFASSAGKDINRAFFGEGGGPLKAPGDWLKSLDWPFGPNHAPDWFRIGNDAGVEISAGTADGLAAGIEAEWRSRLAAALDEGVKDPIGDSVRDGVERAAAIAGENAKKINAAIAQGLNQGPLDPKEWRQRLRDLMKLPSPDQLYRDAYNLGVGAMKVLHRGVQEGNPFKVAGSVEAIGDALAQIALLPKGAQKFGGQAANNLARELRAARASASPAARDTINGVLAILYQLEPGAKTAGSKGGKGYTKGIEGEKTGATGAAKKTKTAAAAAFEGGGTLAFRYGSDLVNAYTRGMTYSSPNAIQEAARIAALTHRQLLDDPGSPAARRAFRYGYDFIANYAGGIRAAASLISAAMPAFGGSLTPLLATASTQTIRHLVTLDLQNAPAGVTNEGVARILGPVLDWTAQERAADAAARMPSY
jgi:hypothetical protein